MSKVKFTVAILLLVLTSTALSQSYSMPHEAALHEGTWLQWPHHHEYGITYRNRLDDTWVAMTSALVESENVHIIAYNSAEQTRITNLLNTAGISLTNVDFQLFQTNDVWVRDNGPIFVRDSDGILLIQDWGFNGWGGKYNYNLCDPIPTNVGSAIAMSVVNLNSVMTIEGGAYELDGNGVWLGCKSSTLSQSPSNSVRNLGMTQQDAELILTQYLGVSKYIWLDGYTGTDDITDAHIDGFAKFANDSTLVTMNNSDLNYWGLSSADITTLNNATNVNNVPYNFVFLPLTQNNVTTTYGNNLGYKGSYCNYYIGNTVVLVPNYNDVKDEVANAIIQELHPERTVIGIDCRNLYENGGMVHCVTQQQPTTSTGIGIYYDKNEKILIGQNYPNPFNHSTSIAVTLDKTAAVKIEIYNSLGQSVFSQIKSQLPSGKNLISIDADSLENGIYSYRISIDNQHYSIGVMMVQK
jgi:agmatine deiminase